MGTSLNITIVYQPQNSGMIKWLIAFTFVNGSTFETTLYVILS
jgi:hypothetical protein